MISMKALLEYIGSADTGLLYGVMQYPAMPTSVSAGSGLSLQAAASEILRPGLSVNLMCVGLDQWPTTGAAAQSANLPTVAEMIRLVRGIFNVAPHGGWTIARVNVVAIPAADAGVGVVPSNFDVLDDITHKFAGPGLTTIIKAGGKSIEFSRIDVFLFISWGMAEVGFAPGATCFDSWAWPGWVDSDGLNVVRRPSLRLNRKVVDVARTFAHELGHFVAWLGHASGANLMTSSKVSSSTAINGDQADDFLDTWCDWYSELPP